MNQNVVILELLYLDPTDIDYSGFSRYHTETTITSNQVNLWIYKFYNFIHQYL